MRPTTRQWIASGLWPGLIAYLMALVGTFALGSDTARYIGIMLLVVAAALAVLIWRGQSWLPTFSSLVFPLWQGRVRVWPLVGVLGGGLLLLGTDLIYSANPGEPFGLAGWLWLVSIALLVISALAWPKGKPVQPQEAAGSPTTAGAIEVPWQRWEYAVFAGIVLFALVLRVWRLSDYPYNIYPDEIMTGSVAAGAFGGGHSTPLFSTVWGGIDLPALWFRIVYGFVEVGGSTLTMLRLPAALFGAATVVPFYLLVRGVWGRTTAISGAVILAVSAPNIHFSRLALNNIVTPFFWAVCFLFLLRGLRSGKPIDWVVAGLAAGLSEHFYYGTRLLSFVLLAFVGYLLLIHWRQARRYVGHFALLGLGYLAGFGPLLAYFIRNPNLYFGRAAQMSVWHGIPTSLDDLGRMVGTLWPIMMENLLGFSTQSSQDIIFYAPLLLPAEAAMLVLGVALLVWQWHHPAAFLMLLSGLGVLFVGGTLVMSLNSAPPQINHWTGAFPAFYAAIAIPIGAWAARAGRALPVRFGWAVPAAVGVGLAALALSNIVFYFGSYHSDPAILKNESYSRAQGYYEVQTAQSRYFASLGTGYRVVKVGQLSQPYDPATTRYLLGVDMDVVNAVNPEADLTGVDVPGKGMALVFFPGNEQYIPLVQDRWPGGVEGGVKNPAGVLMFYTYVVAPKE